MPVRVGDVDVIELLCTDFTAMGTDVEVLVVDGDDDLLHWAAREVHRLERLWSRFLPESDVSRVNRAAGRAVAVSVDTIDLVGRALRAHRHTDGAFDPLLGAALVALGYDRSFDRLVRARGAPPAAGSVATAGSTREGTTCGLEVDRERSTVRVPVGSRLDLGGIAKGHAADLLVAALVESGAQGACVNLGGDLAVGGRAPDRAGWLIGLEDGPEGPGPLAVRSGGVATSTTRRRRWVDPAGAVHHHLLDPRTGDSCIGPVLDATVVACSATLAEVLAKVAVVRPARLPDAVAATGAAARLVYADGSTAEIGTLPWA